MPATSPMTDDEQTKAVDPVDYTDEEIKYRSELVTRLQYSYDKRQNKYAEFNDMTYEDYWESNAKAANSYIMPKRNEQDVRIVTGTTEEKDNTLLSSLLNNNLEPNIQAYDKHELPIRELGEIMEDLIKKSRKLEMPDYDQKRILIYKELLDQGTAFVEDTYVEMRVPKKVLKNMKWREGGVDKIQWDARQDEVNRYCNANLITGLNVYLGSMREFYMDYQPYVFTHRIRPRWELEAVYKNWPRWKKVPYRITQATQPEATTTRAYNDWSLESVYEDQVEEIKFYSYWLNEYMIMLNGVLMLPPGFPLEGLVGINILPIIKGDIAPINRNFAYSKSIPAKTKVDQAVFDEMLKLMILKTRQSYEPPKANNTGQTLSKRIFFPGTMTPNIDVSKLPNIVEPTGVTASEFNMAEFMKKIIDDKSVSPVFQGQSLKGGQTAREIVELKQQSMMKMGLTILGVINFEKRLCWNRLYNIVYNWTKPNEDNVYRTVTVESEFGDGLKGKRIVEFRKTEPPEDGQIEAEEDLLTIKYGEPVRKVYINPVKLRSMPKHFFIEIVPTPKDTSDLQKAVFNETLQTGYALFGPQAFNQEYTKQRWANLNGEDPEKLLAPPAPQMPGGVPGMPGGGQGGELMSQMTQGAQPPQAQLPSLKQLANA